MEVNYTELKTVKDYLNDQVILWAYVGKKSKKDKEWNRKKTDEDQLMIKYYDWYKEQQVSYPIDSIDKLWYNNYPNMQEFLDSFKWQKIVLNTAVYIQIV